MCDSWPANGSCEYFYTPYVNLCCRATLRHGAKVNQTCSLHAIAVENQMGKPAPTIQNQPPHYIHIHSYIHYEPSILWLCTSNDWCSFAKILMYYDTSPEKEIIHGNQRLLKLLFFLLQWLWTHQSRTWYHMDFSEKFLQRNRSESIQRWLYTSWGWWSQL